MKIVKMAQSGYIKIYNLLVSLAASILTLTETGGTIATDGTEQILYVNDTPAGVFSPNTINVDFTNQFNGTTVVLKEYYRIKSGGDLRLTDMVAFPDGQSPDLKIISLKENRFGIIISIQKTAGANANYDYEVFYKI